MSDPIQLGFDGDGDLLLYFLSSATWPLRYNPNVFIGNIGIGLNRKAVKRNDTPDEEKQPNTEN